MTIPEDKEGSPRQEAPAPSPICFDSPCPVADESRTDVAANETPSEAPGNFPSASSPSLAAVAGPSETHIGEHEQTFVFGARRWRARGLAKNASLDVRRVNLMCRLGEAFYVDTVDLNIAKQRHGFVAAAATELDLEPSVLKREMGLVFEGLEAYHEQLLCAADDTAAAGPPPMTDAQRSEAMAFLRDPKIIDRIVEDFSACGVVGEETNKIVGYLAATSRLLERPLAVVIQSSSAAGKSSLMDAVLAFIPEEERVKFSAITGQSLYYMGDTDLKHKVLAIAEESGAHQASYPLKLLQSEGELTIASTGKDPVTGRLVTQEYRVEGPVMILLTTTAIDVDDELLNRCIVLSVAEDEAQTQAIHEQQRESETFEGAVRRREGATAARRRHQNAQRLLRPLLVTNPFAKSLTFISNQTRTRRDHAKYLALIRTVALLRQYQRPVQEGVYAGERVEYIEATADDIALANGLARDVLGRSLKDLPPQTHRLLQLITQMVDAACRRESLERFEYCFLRRDVRGYTRWSDTPLKVHMSRLVDLEYLSVHSTGRGRSYVYRLTYGGDGQDVGNFLAGLIDADSLTKAVSSCGTDGSLPVATPSLRRAVASVG